MRADVEITVFLLVVVGVVVAAPPLRLTIDCGTDDQPPLFGSPLFRSKAPELFGNNLDVDSFCKMIHSAIPKAVKDGKFIPMEAEPDQTGFADTQVAVAVESPKIFPKIHKLKLPRLKVPKINVPMLRPSEDSFLGAPRVGRPMSLPLPTLRREKEDETSAERMERFKKGVQKMLHVVKVLGQVDQYLSERTRIVVDKLSKTFAE